MKKILCLLTAALTFILAACTAGEDCLDFPYARYLGQEKWYLFEDLGISEEEVTYEVDSHMIMLEDRAQELNGFRFVPMFEVFPTAGYEEIVTGVYYCMVDMGRALPDEVCVKLAKDIAAEMTARYGEPITYPGIQNRLAAVEPENFVPPEQYGSYFDDWDVPGDDPVAMSVTLSYQPDTVIICMKYKPNMIVDGQRIPEEEWEAFVDTAVQRQRKK